MDAVSLADAKPDDRRSDGSGRAADAIEQGQAHRQLDALSAAIERARVWTRKLDVCYGAGAIRGFIRWPSRGGARH